MARRCRRGRRAARRPSTRPRADPTSEDGTTAREDETAFAVVAGYPVESESDPDYRRETVFTSDDFAEVGSVEGGGESLPPSVRVEPTEAAARRFVDVLTDNGFTDEGVANCRWNSDDDDPGWCLLTVLDGEVAYGAGLSRGLASSVESGAYLDDPTFVVSASDEAEAERIRDAIRNGTR
ncbi:preprotein translocase subunit SecD family protein [Halorussus halobius]|uniref:hypothetical protein n=1 Tax=Halorussus halobius TaxID=1710537 RepID=UPI001092A3C0|nr:hypothetical protein [Halorussus halobius]